MPAAGRGVLTARRLAAVALASVLIAVGVLRSHVLPLLGVVLLGAAVGLLIALRTGSPHDLLRMPALVAVAALVLVGVGQMGVLGILLGLGLLAATTPIHGART
ncbi:hypothetical protein [Nocardioides conyzicola]|uniref:hypothetical protein n=1 Tax=Nocardioides conyzicola TaxID=1651781 RepID=UPI0031E9DE99